MNEDFPAEWFPMSMMLIFFLGAKREKSRLLAISHSPLSGSMYNWWHSCKISICFDYNSCIPNFIFCNITKKSVCRFLPSEYVRLCSWGSLPFPCLPKCVDGSFPTCWNTYQWPEIDLEYYFISAWNFPWLDFCPYFGIVDKEYQYKME